MSTNNCPNCGPYDCYNICPNSPNFYSPEQERYDDANYDPSEYYREGGFYDDLDAMADADDQEADYIEHLTDEEFQAVRPRDSMFEVVGVLTYDACTDTLSTDIPF